MTIYRGTFVDTPDEATPGSATLRVDEDATLLVRDGIIIERGTHADLAQRHPDEGVVDLREGLVLPGLIDTHVHYPQVRSIGALGMPLLDWLEKSALPEEARLEDPDYASGAATEFVRGLLSAGTTTALVFGAHFAPAMENLFAEATLVGLRVTSGLVVSDRALPEPLLTTAERAYDESLALAQKWHGRGRIRYAVTPRFSLSASEAVLEACADLVKELPGAWFTTHANENAAEVAEVARLFPDARDYIDTYDRHGLLGPQSVVAHNVHATDPELATLSARGAAVAHCATSNAALGSGLFALRRHVDHGVRVALGSDVGAGTGFSMFKEGLQAYFMQQLLGPQGQALSPADLLYLATRAGALALGLGDSVGDLGVGKAFDAVWVCPPRGEPLDVGLRHSASTEDAVAKTFAMGCSSDVAGVWVHGERLKGD